jgi:parvulin-like peptidyl-prolyl isomerase
MPLRRKSGITALCLLALAAFARPQEVVDGIAARVETDIILLSEVHALARYQMFIDGKAETDGVILDRLIDQWMVRNEAKAALFPQPSEEEMKRSLERLKRSFSSPEEYEQRRKQSGLTAEDVERMLRSQLYLGNYLDSRFRASIQIEEKEIEEFYKEHVVPRAESRGQSPPTLDAARGFIQDVLVRRAIDVQADRWLKESRGRLHVEKLLMEGAK